MCIRDRLEARVAAGDLSEKQQRSELNFWNGKVTNMRRDLDFQQAFNEQLIE